MPSPQPVPPDPYGAGAAYAPAFPVHHPPGNGAYGATRAPSNGFGAPPRFAHGAPTGVEAGGKGRRRAIVAAIAAALLAAALGAWLLAGRDDGRGGTAPAAVPQDPVTALEAFLTSVRDRDYAAAARLVCSGQNVSADQLSAVFEQQFGKTGIESFRVAGPDTASGSGPALLRYELVAGGRSLPFQATLNEVDGTWCVANNKQVS